MYTCILGVSGLGLLMGKLHQFLTFVNHKSVVSFPDDNLSKYEWIFTNCIDIGDLVWDRK